jgi:hypothetical protein
MFPVFSGRTLRGENTAFYQWDELMQYQSAPIEGYADYRGVSFHPAGIFVSEQHLGVYKWFEGGKHVLEFDGIRNRSGSGMGAE